MERAIAQPNAQTQKLVAAELLCWAQLLPEPDKGRPSRHQLCCSQLLLWSFKNGTMETLSDSPSLLRIDTSERYEQPLLKRNAIVRKELSEGILFIFSSVVAHKWKKVGSTYHSRKSNTVKITKEDLTNM